jgi:20S proteasome alpha/beta subunit
MYNRRTKGNPLWNSFVVGGIDKATQEGFLSYVDLIGTTYSAPSIATGYGSYIAQPLLRKVLDDLPNGHLDLTPELARKTLEESMKVLFYRDARSLNKVCSSYSTQTFSTPSLIRLIWFSFKSLISLSMGSKSPSLFKLQLNGLLPKDFEG